LEVGGKIILKWSYQVFLFIQLNEPLDYSREGITADLWRDFWIRETGTDQQVAHLHDRYIMIMMMMLLHVSVNKPSSGSLLPCFAKVMIIIKIVKIRRYQFYW